MCSPIAMSWALAPRIPITLADNRELQGTMMGYDPHTDLAVVKVDAGGFTPLPWGDSAKLRVAEWVLAVGNPFAFSRTVTLGIVSSANRHDPQLARYNDFIQTDAAINPGNSGGALDQRARRADRDQQPIYSRAAAIRASASRSRSISRADHDRADKNKGSCAGRSGRSIFADDGRPNWRAAPG